MARKIFVTTSLLILASIGGVAIYYPAILWSLVVILPLVLLGIYDMLQREHTILRNFPLLGHFRYIFEMIRPEIQQYFVETTTDGAPFNREIRSIVYQRSKGVLQTIPFGTQHNPYEEGYEWVIHSLYPQPLLEEEPRVLIGKDTCQHPYRASRLNISAMSFGSISAQAIRALNGGAKKGGFAHNTGEGGLSPYHLEGGGDLIWQIGTGYFGCRTLEGKFDGSRFEEQARQKEVKMIEIKISQGAKPGHGGILPGEKVDAKIAQVRGVPQGKSVISPPSHSAFSGSEELLEFISRLRELSGGKPVGIKLCVGREEELLDLARAMVKTELYPDFITVDGAEGGTGAAPLEFANWVGMPLRSGLIMVHNTLRGINYRDRVKIGASGKIITAFDIFRTIALGADFCYSARGMMFALGCIQALRCNSNVCPTGIATQDPSLTQGIHVPSKAQRVYRYHRDTIKIFLELLSSVGLSSPDEISPELINRRVEHDEILNYSQIYSFIEPGSLLEEEGARPSIKAHRRMKK